MYLSSVLVMNFMSKLCNPPTHDAEVKANKGVTLRVNYLSVNFSLLGKLFFK